MDSGISIRADKVNEDYYARRNAPTWHQFVGKYHFVDDAGRQYMIAEKNDQVFQNERLKFKFRVTKPLNTRQKPKECVTNLHGHVKLFVKLPNTRTIHWFKHSDINKSLTLYDVHNNSVIYSVTLMSTDKADRRSATGSIYVKGLTPRECQSFINK